VRSLTWTREGPGSISSDLSQPDVRLNSSCSCCNVILYRLIFEIEIVSSCTLIHFLRISDEESCAYDMMDVGIQKGVKGGMHQTGSITMSGSISAQPRSHDMAVRRIRARQSTCSDPNESAHMRTHPRDLATVSDGRFDSVSYTAVVHFYGQYRSIWR
jgi:hypothetical protein